MVHGFQTKDIMCSNMLHVFGAFFASLVRVRVRVRSSLNPNPNYVIYFVHDTFRSLPKPADLSPPPQSRSPMKEVGHQLKRAARSFSTGALGHGHTRRPAGAESRTFAPILIFLRRAKYCKTPKQANFSHPLLGC